MNKDFGLFTASDIEQTYRANIYIYICIYIDKITAKLNGLIWFWGW